jgi:hypothetical protein
MVLFLDLLFHVSIFFVNSLEKAQLILNDDWEYEKDKQHNSPEFPWSCA